MTRWLTVLLVLFFLNGPAIGGNSDFRRCTIAAEGGSVGDILAGHSNHWVHRNDVFA